MVQPSPSSPSYPTPTSPPPRESATRPGTSISAMSASTSATGEPSLLSSTQGDRLAGQPGGSHVAATEPITAVNPGSTSFNSSNQLDNGINTTSSTRGQHHTTDITSSTPFATLPAHPSASSASLNRSANLEISSPPLPDARPEQSAYSDTLTGTVAPNGPTAGASMGSPLISRAESPTTARQHESASNSGHDIAIKSDIDDDLRFDTDMDTNAYHEHVHDIKPVKSESGALDSPSATPKQRLSSPPDSTSDRYGFKSETASGSTSPKRESTVDGLSGGRVIEAGDDDEDDYVKSQSSKKIAVKSEPGTPGGGASKSRNRRRKEIESEPQFIDHLPSANEQVSRATRSACVCAHLLPSIARACRLYDLMSRFPIAPTLLKRSVILRTLMPIPLDAIARMNQVRGKDRCLSDPTSRADHLHPKKKGEYRLAAKTRNA